MNTSATACPTLSWTVVTQSQHQLQDAHGLLAQLRNDCPVSLGRLQGASAYLDWTDAPTLQAWIALQPDAVLLDTLATTREAQSANLATHATMQAALQHVLQQSALSLDALAFTLDLFRQANLRLAQLHGLASQLHAQCLGRGLTVAPPVDTSQWLTQCQDTVLDRPSGMTYGDSAAYGEQMAHALASVPEPSAAPDDGRVPFDELMAIFNPSWSAP